MSNEWTKGFKTIEERAKAIKGHKSFEAGQREVKGDDGKPTGKKIWFIKNKLRTSTLGIVTVQSIVPSSMEWTPEQVKLLKSNVRKAARKVLIQAVEAKNNGNFSKATFQVVPRLTPEQKKARETEKAARKAKRDAEKVERDKKLEAHRKEVEDNKKIREQAKKIREEAAAKIKSIKKK